MKEVMESISARRSIRKYNGKPLSSDHEKAILEYISNEDNMKGIHGNHIVISLIKNDGSFGEKIGTYGMIQGAPAFLSIACKNDQDNMLDVGYVFEKMVLFLWELGIGTCWMGGTFKRKQFPVEDGKFIPIVSPIGYDSEKLLLKDKVIRTFANSDRRKNFDDIFFFEDFSQKISDEETRDVLKMVRLSPSASNKQPWRVVINSDGSADFYIERTPGYVGAKMGFDMQWLDIGIALAHYELASGKKDYVCQKPSRKMLSDYSEYVISVK